MIKLQDFLNVVSIIDMISVYYRGNKIAYGFSNEIIDECENYLDYQVTYFASSTFKLNELVVIL